MRNELEARLSDPGSKVSLDRLRGCHEVCCDVCKHIGKDDYWSREDVSWLLGLAAPLLLRP